MLPDRSTTNTTRVPVTGMPQKPPADVPGPFFASGARFCATVIFDFSVSQNARQSPGWSAR